MRRARPRRLLILAAAVTLLSIPTVALAVHVFDDVGDASTHADGIHYVADAGITSGCDADNFCPGDTLTRGQMATFLYHQSGNAAGVAPSVNAASIAEVVQVSDQNAIVGSAVNTASVSCPDGMLATGGGSQTTSPTGWVQAYSRPLADSSGWTAQYVQIDGQLGANTTTVWAQCVAVGGP